jgi:hypothetical protein
MRSTSGLLKAVAVLAIAVVLQACGGGGGGVATIAPVTPGGGGVNAPTPTTVVSGSTATVVLTGVASYASVPNNTATAALNYAGTVNKPIRGATVQAISGTTVLASAVTSDTGSYTLSVPGNTLVSIRVRAELIKTSAGPTWNVAVLDNTNSGALWVVESAPTTTGSADSTRSFVAGSGWNTATQLYNANSRAAAPFAILDTIYTSMKLVTTVQPAAVFPALAVFWSPNNKPTNGNVALGEIGTSYFTQNSLGDRAMYILGDEGVDTDEYDSSVIAHEYGHYLQSAFSTAHSTGGAHSSNNKLDMTLAFSEAWGNSFSSMARNSPIYADSALTGQASGFTMNLGSAPVDANRGWYREDSIGSVLYGLFAGQGAVTAQGFAPIWTALTGPMKTTQNALASIFSFTEAVTGAGNATVNTALNTLRTAQNINGTDQWGATETINNGGNAGNLPIYNTISAVGTPVQTCFITANLGASTSINKLGAVKYYRHTLSAANAGTHTITANFAAGRDIDFEVFQNRVLVASATGISLATTTSESASAALVAGEVIIRVRDYDTATPPVAPNCATITIN